VSAVTVAVFMSNFGFAAVIFLLLLAVIFLLNSFQKKTLSVLSRLSATYNDIETLLVRITNSIELMNNQVKGLESQIKNIEEIQELLQRELTRLADGTSAQGQLTQAIELARDGASVSDIMSSTKLPKEEAEAIARYHNAQKG
jgi:peptidoglycan hydrolase CwlO-like protein